MNILCFSWGILIVTNNGLEQRAKINSISDIKVYPTAFKPENSPFGFCQLFKDSICVSESANPTILLIVDSHGKHSYLGLKDYFSLTNQNIALIGKGGCPPFIDVERFAKTSGNLGCHTFFSKVIKWIENNEGIEKVFLVARGAYYINGDGFRIDGKRTDPGIIRSYSQSGQRSTTQVLANSINKTFEALTIIDKEIIYLHDVPELGFHIKSCIPLRPFQSTPKSTRHRLRADCRIPKKMFDKRYSIYHDLVDDIANVYPTVTTINMSIPLCDKDYCYGKIDDKYLYADDDHLSKVGSLYVFKNLTKYLDEM